MIDVSHEAANLELTFLSIEHRFFQISAFPEFLLPVYHKFSARSFDKSKKNQRLLRYRRRIPSASSRIETWKDSFRSSKKINWKLARFLAAEVIG